MKKKRRKRKENDRTKSTGTKHASQHFHPQSLSPSSGRQYRHRCVLLLELRRMCLSLTHSPVPLAVLHPSIPVLLSRPVLFYHLFLLACFTNLIRRCHCGYRTKTRIVVPNAPVGAPISTVLHLMYVDLLFVCFLLSSLRISFRADGGLWSAW